MSTCPLNDLAIGEAFNEGVLIKWLSTVRHAEPGSLMVARMELEENGFKQPTVRSGSWRLTH